MQNLLSLTLAAHHPARNHHRHYELLLGRDLFGDWTVTLRYGRIGTCGQTQQFSSHNVAELRGMIRERLRRRLSAPRRIGCAYRLVGLSVAAGCEPAEWLPADIVARFVAAN